ncbi:hypothetical protein F7R91_14645 [Streptomyces luteolifulvus]|uniref:Uncharacterized protein n=1 Tax=Streptomyces luteolifulvus TaxID=2615112 RepID=A0A6H9V2F6_9ACTN|nr:hypothetical protein [Streptomyces luteolifulvus]KAB1146813.1 hypothetical protein F7R91_14645 [Streptomyces luteolifulvus]
MSNLVFNVSLGRIAYLASLPAANDGLVLIALESSGLETDAVLRDKDDFAAVVSGTTNEQTTVGRKPLTGVTATIDDTNDRVALDADDVTWTSPTGNAVGAVVICYDPDTTTGTDADLIPLTKHDLSWTPDGNNFTLTISDFARSSSAA